MKKKTRKTASIPDAQAAHPTKETVGGEIRNQVAVVKTMALLLPAKWDDPKFRKLFRRHVMKSLAVIDRMAVKVLDVPKSRRAT